MSNWNLSLKRLALFEKSCGKAAKEHAAQMDVIKMRIAQDRVFVQDPESSVALALAALIP